MFGFASTRASNKGKCAVVVKLYIVEMTNILQVTVFKIISIVVKRQEKMGWKQQIWSNAAKKGCFNVFLILFNSKYRYAKCEKFINYKPWKEGIEKQSQGSGNGYQGQGGRGGGLQRYRP